MPPTAFISRVPVGAILKMIISVSLLGFVIVITKNAGLYPIKAPVTRILGNTTVDDRNPALP